MSAAPFEILEHTADIGVRVYGGTHAELFQNAALAVETVALDIEAVEPQSAFELSADAEDVEALLVNWLNEVIYWIDGRRIVMSRFDVQAFAETRIAAKGWGEPRDAERHPARLVVKAATYHQLSIRRSNDGYVAEVYLDI